MTKGRYGEFGGQYVPETLMNAVNELEEAYNKYGLKEDEIIFESATFETGYEVDIKLVIPDSESYTWTEAILFDIDNNQVVFTEPSDLFFGEWVLIDEKNNDKYTFIIK